MQVLYDEGSQISLVNKYCSPLIVDSRKTDHPVKISGVMGESFDIRQIHKMDLREGVEIKGILVPYLAINPTTVKRPNCLQTYDS